MNVKINDKQQNNDRRATSDDRRLTKINSWRTAGRSLLTKFFADEIFRWRKFLTVQYQVLSSLPNQSALRRETLSSSSVELNVEHCTLTNTCMQWTDPAWTASQNDRACRERESEHARVQRWVHNDPKREWLCVIDDTLEILPWQTPKYGVAYSLRLPPMYSWLRISPQTTSHTISVFCFQWFLGITELTCIKGVRTTERKIFEVFEMENRNQGFMCDCFARQECIWYAFSYWLTGRSHWAQSDRWQGLQRSRFWSRRRKSAAKLVVNLISKTSLVYRIDRFTISTNLAQHKMLAHGPSTVAMMSACSHVDFWVYKWAS